MNVLINEKKTHVMQCMLYICWNIYDEYKCNYYVLQGKLHVTINFCKKSNNDIYPKYSCQINNCDHFCTVHTWNQPNIINLV